MDFALYSLGVVVSVLALAGGLLALWRLIPRNLAAEALSDLRTRVTELEIGFQSFAAQYELEVNRSRQKLARAKRDLARERGEDIDEESQPAPPSVQPSPPQPVDKTEMRRQFFGGNRS